MERKLKKGKEDKEGIGSGGGRGRKREWVWEDFEPVPWQEYEDGRPTRPVGFEFVVRERVGWRERL